MNKILEAGLSIFTTTKSRSACLAVVASMLLPISATADSVGYEVVAYDADAKPRYFKTLDLSEIANATVLGDFFPGPGLTNFDGIPFSLAGDYGHGIVSFLEFGSNGFSHSAAEVSVSGLNVPNAKKMYAIVNSTFGECVGSNEVILGSIGVSGPSGVSSVDFQLIEGKNVRDWLTGPFCNVQTDAIYTAEYFFEGIPPGIPAGPANFDIYEFDLSGMNEPITQLTFRNFANYDVFLGSPFLVAVTFELIGPQAGAASH
jgi:hypothetical protein